MVFEKALTTLLNRYLGEYIENLDGQQLNFGVMSGELELKRLQMKASALSELDLPITCVKGSIGKLALKVPWRSMYSSPTIVTIQDVFLLVVPNQSITYDEAKENKAIMETKQKALKKIEDAKKADAEKEKKKTDPTFVEKMITTIIKNVQINIEGIHIRYEDTVTNPISPFSFGITLWKLDVASTDANWNKAIVDDISKVYKVVNLDSLAVYWNCNTKLYKQQTVDGFYKNMFDNIGKDTEPASGYSYILGPISATARLRMNQRPENDVPEFSIPKIHLNVDMQKLYIGVSKAQYRDLIAVLDSMSRMAKGAPYRKFRPNVDGYHGHYKEWWDFAINCVLEDIIKKKMEWEWGHIKAYRDMCRSYQEVYKKKLKKTLKSNEQEFVDKFERKLDVTSIVIIRQKVELELEREAQIQATQSWFSWGRASSSGQNVKPGAAILKEFQDEMTPEEKRKLYKAIGYSESAGPVEFPIEFVDQSGTIVLRELDMEFRDDECDVKTVLFSTLKTVKVKVETRSAGAALNAYVKIDDFKTLGLKQGDFVPELIISETEQSEGEQGLLNVSFETNPLDAKCDQRIKVVAQPLRIVYDAQTINKIVDIFAVPADSNLDQIQAAAGTGLTNFKQMTSTGLQHTIAQHLMLDVDIDFKAPYVIIPYKGKFTGNENVLVANLGRLKMYSFGRHASVTDIRMLVQKGIEKRDIFEQLKEQSYDKFKLELTDLQILMAQSSEDWRTAIKESATSDMHMLNPLSLNITYSKCLVVDDPRLPHNKISGELPSVDINISEARLMLLVILGISIPLPASDIPEPQPLTKGKTSSSRLLLKYMEMQKNAMHKDVLPPDTDRKELIQFTTLEAKFLMTELSFTINKQETITSGISEVACFKINSLRCGLLQQTYNTNVSLLLGSITLHQNREGDIINILSTPITNRAKEYLFKVQFIQVDPKSPELHSVHKSCETSLILDFRILGIILHQEGLLTLLQFTTSIQEEIAELTKSYDRVGRTDSGRKLPVIAENVADTTIQAVKKPRKKIPVTVESIKFRVRADMQQVTVTFATDKSNISTCAIIGINCDVIVKNTYTQINAKLHDITVIDLNPNTAYGLIISGTEGVALVSQIVLNNLETESEKPDMDVNVKMGGMKIVFLNYFVTNMLNFVNQFQTAQQALIDASQAAAQTAKENVKDAYAKATKISLNVNIKAPDIIVPVNSQSYDALCLDLGVISLSNTFLTLDVKNEEGHSVVVDDLKVSLSELKVSRIRTNEEYDTVRECVLVEPINLEIGIKRNLTTSWYTSIPDIDISAKINTIKLLLSQADYHMMMSILSGNLVEGQVNKPEAPRVIDKRSNVTNTTIGTNISVTPQLETEVVKVETSKVHVFLKFTFAMDRFIIDLYSGGVKSLTTESPCHDSSDQMGRFSLEGLSVKGRILTDDSIVTSILLINCLLDDMRHYREGKLNRLIQRAQGDADQKSTTSSTESLPPARSMIDITFQQKRNDMFADVRIFSFTMILSVDYLLKLADFFAEPAQQTRQTQTKSATSVAKPTGSRATTVTATQPTQSEIQMTINLKLEKPDIILVEDMDNINTNAMILNSEILVKLRIAGEHQVINGVIKDLQLYTCNYNPAHRATTKAHVLYPVTISLAGSTPQDKGLHVELLVTNIRLSVSPATIELLNRVVVTMTRSGASEEESTEEDFNYMELWNQTLFADSDYWFLNIENAMEALEEVPSSEPRVPTRLPMQELCIISMPSIVLTVEAGVGSKTFPMLLLETSFRGSARNWSSQLNVEASLTIQMGYYNSRLAVWEPLIEPVETVQRRGHFEPWELKLELSMNEQEDVTSPSSETGGATQTQPVMTADIISENNLEITITKTCLEVLQNLGKAFATAMETERVKHVAAVHAPFKVLNEIGEDITLLLEKSSFRLAEGGSLADINRSSTVPLQLKLDMESEGMLHLSQELTTNAQKIDRFLHVKINSKNWEMALPIVRADKRFFMLNYRGDGHDNWGVISDVTVDEGVTLITIRSIIQVYNHFSVPVEVYYMTAKGNELEMIGLVQPASFLNVPLKAVYTPTSELFFTVAGYSITCAPYIWKDLQANLNVNKLLQCPQKDIDKPKGPFVIKAVGEIEQVYYENTSRHTMASTCYNIHLRPAVIIKNCLPIDIICCVDELPEETQLKAGDTLQLHNVEPGYNVLVIRLPDYLEKEWSCRKEVSIEYEEFAVWTFNSYDSPAKMALELGMHTLDKNGTLVMSLYCPFWMLNKTELMLGYRKSKKTEKNEATGSPAKSSDDLLNVLHHPPNFRGPILFSFNAKNFFGKKKASIRVESGEWSDKFSLDVAGSSGVVNCKFEGQKYQIGVHIQLTYNTLTKQVTFTPYYVIMNNAPFPIECQEYDRPADAWITIEPKSCSALWPHSELEDKLMRLRVVGTSEVTAPFLYTESHNSLLRLNNKFGGINVDIQLTEGAVYVNLAPYESGSAPALLVNHLDFPINYWEKDTFQERVLQPKHSILFTWENPAGPRILCWDKGTKKEIQSDLRKDACGEYPLTEDVQVCWASFLDGMQRVLLFTGEKGIAEDAQASNLLQVIQQEVNVSVHGLGISLVNNLHRQEIMYIGIASSGIIWENCKLNGKRYKPLGTKESMHLEVAYQNYLHRQQDDEQEGDQEGTGQVTIMDGRMVVDFEAGLILKPTKRHIRRSFQTGLWLQMKTSPSQLQLHAKINRLQIDNQMFDCIFPVVLAPIPPPKSVAADSGIKPFVELSIVQLLMKNSQVRQFKYFKVLVQEFHIKVDLGFLNAIVDFLEQAEDSDEEKKKLFLTDMKLVDEPLYSHASMQSIQEQKSFYDLLHFSPLKIHISFSMASGSTVGQTASTPNFLKILLQGLGVTLTDLQDVVFKLAFFERTFTFLTQKQLISEVTNHYVGQSVKQLYVLVLGLDVIGNPYGLVVGITKGVEDLFYEPFQGAIQGPDEFAEGLALGVKSLFGHTVGGAAGAVSRITGAMGKGIAALTFDEEFQRKRREALNKKPATVQEGFARSGKGLVMGVYSGVTGVFTKPVEGAREQGVEGFFKGLGKGAVGLVTRPVAGVVDFASGSLDVVKRATETGVDVSRLRPPRFLQADGLVRPYNSHEAEGHRLLNEVHKGKYSSTDVYVAHYDVIEKKEILLLTDKRVAYVCRNDIFGGWQVEWSYTWNEVPQPPRVVPKGIILTTSEKKKKLLSSGDATKAILIGNASIKEEICLKIESLRSA